MMPSKRKILLGTIILFILIIFIVIPAYIAYASVHPPRCGYHETPSAYDLSFREVQVNINGIVLKGWDIDPQALEKEPIIIIMHGYTSCKANPRHLKLARDLAEQGYRVIMFDFRAHGESEGDVTTIGPIEAEEDAPAIVDYVSSNYPNRPIALIGYSMGAVVAIMEGVADDRVDVIIADSPYPLLNTVIPRWLKATMGIPEWYSSIIGFWGKLLGGVDTNYGPMKLSRIDKPLLVIVGTEDPLLKPEEAKEIASKSCCGDVLIVEGAGHIESYDVLGEAYVDTITGFIDEHTGGLQATASSETMKQYNIGLNVVSAYLD